MSKINQLLDQISSGSLTESAANFKSILAEKIQTKLDEKRKSTMKSDDDCCAEKKEEEDEESEIKESDQIPHELLFRDPKLRSKALYHLHKLGPDVSINTLLGKVLGN